MKVIIRPTPLLDQYDNTKSDSNTLEPKRKKNNRTLEKYVYIEIIDNVIKVVKITMKYIKKRKPKFFITL